MMIRIDPMELVETSRVLDGAASEAVDIGTQLAACVRCPMPPALRVSVDHLVAAADAVLDSVAVRLHAEAVDLARRAVIAANDSLAAATGVAVGAGPASSFAAGSMVIGGNSSQSFTILNANGTLAGPMPNMSVIGGNSSPSFTILNANGTPAGPMPNMSIVGGSSWSTPSTGFSPLTGVIGPSSGDPYGLMSLARAQQASSDRARVIINRIVSNPNSSPYALGVAMDAQTSIGRSASRPLLPSKLDMENKAGHLLTWAEYYRRVPEAAPQSFSGLF